MQHLQNEMQIWYSLSKLRPRPRYSNSKEFEHEGASNVFRPHYTAGILKNGTITGHFKFGCQEVSLIQIT